MILAILSHPRYLLSLYACLSYDRASWIWATPAAIVANCATRIRRYCFIIFCCLLAMPTSSHSILLSLVHLLNSMHRSQLITTTTGSYHHGNRLVVWTTPRNFWISSSTVSLYPAPLPRRCTRICSYATSMTSHIFTHISWWSADVDSMSNSAPATRYNLQAGYLSIFWYSSSTLICFTAMSTSKIILRSHFWLSCCSFRSPFNYWLLSSSAPLISQWRTPACTRNSWPGYPYIIRTSVVLFARMFHFG